MCPMSKPKLSVVVPLVLVSAVSVLAAAYVWLGMCLAFWAISMLLVPLIALMLFVAAVGWLVDVACRPFYPFARIR